MTELDFDKLTRCQNPEKISQKDLVYAINGNLTGGTTVAATMYVAWKSGIKVFATGGVGGVHRNAEHTMDISSDIMAFSRYPVIVVSAGAKAILDLGKTLESLETLSVPVLGYKTDFFPAFYSSKSPYRIRRVDSCREIAELYQIQHELGLWNGILIANPIPIEHEIPGHIIEEKIEHAIIEANSKKILGKELTPFLLSKIVDMTDGKSLKSNIELIKNNVLLGCKLAEEVLKIK
jgi:pseudouridine-5'-phosphate glycosidase